MAKKIICTVTKEKLEDLYSTLCVRAEAQANALNQGVTEAESKKYKDEAKEALDAYNKAATTMAYESWHNGDDSIQTMIKAGYIPGLKRYSCKQDKTSGIYKATVSDTKGKISLVGYQMIIGKGDFHDPEWFIKAQKLAYIVANALNDALGKVEGFSYAVDEAAKAFDFAENADPKSTRSVVSALQQVADSILFIPTKTKAGAEVNTLKMRSIEWGYIRECMTRQGTDIGSVVIGNTEKMAELVADVMYLMLNGKGYSIVEG